MYAIKVFLLGAIAAGASCQPASNFKLTRHAQEQAANNYIAHWNGDFSKQQETFMPNVNFYQDRVPRANGTQIVTIDSSDALVKWMKAARVGWDHYQFVVDNVAYSDYDIVLRWTLNATVGPADKMTIPVKVPRGTHIGYNGTDWLQLDHCTGKIKQVDEAQDFFTALHAQGFTEILI